jgi:hypothetical protein
VFSTLDQSITINHHNLRTCILQALRYAQERKVKALNAQHQPFSGLFGFGSPAKSNQTPQHQPPSGIFTTVTQPQQQAPSGLFTTGTQPLGQLQQQHGSSLPSMGIQPQPKQQQQPTSLPSIATQPQPQQQQQQPSTLPSMGTQLQQQQPPSWFSMGGSQPQHPPTSSTLGTMAKVDQKPPAGMCRLLTCTCAPTSLGRPTLVSVGCNRNNLKQTVHRVG